MKSVGETMSIGRTFKESLQKAFAAWKSGARDWARRQGRAVDRRRTSTRTLAALLKAACDRERGIFQVAEALRAAPRSKRSTSLTCKMTPGSCARCGNCRGRGRNPRRGRTRRRDPPCSGRPRNSASPTAARLASGNMEEAGARKARKKHGVLPVLPAGGHLRRRV
jgi:hypothetical protein